MIQRECETCFRRALTGYLYCRYCMEEMGFEISYDQSGNYYVVGFEGKKEDFEKVKRYADEPDSSED